MESAQERFTAVITGASTGIGRACALDLASRGWQVFAGVRRSADGDRLRGEGAQRIEPTQIDVTDEQSIAEAVRIVGKKVGSNGLQGLVNNAGIVVASPIEALPIADLRKQLEVNVVGQIAVTQAFIPLLRLGRGRIVNMGSIAGRAALPTMGPYSASKFALEALTDALRLELQAWGIHVSIVEPGAIATPIWEKSKRAAAEIERAANPSLRGLYKDLVARVRDAVAEAERSAIGPEAVATAVRHALTAPHPKTRYLVGTDARIRATMQNVLPDRWQDWLLTRILKLPRT